MIIIIDIEKALNSTSIPEITTIQIERNFILYRASKEKSVAKIIFNGKNIFLLRSGQGKEVCSDNFYLTLSGKF